MLNNSINANFTLNASRIKYLLAFYELDINLFYKKIQGNNKREVISKSNLKKAVDGEEKISLNLLKKIDNIFEKGIMWYVSKLPIPEKERKNIYFRKDKLNANLNFATKKILEYYEDKKVLIENYCNKVEFNNEKEFNFSINDSPRDVANIINNEFKKRKEILINEGIIKKNPNKERDFLEILIRVFEQFNLFIFEHVNYKKKEELIPNFNGFFLSPNLIVIQRQQKYMKREIFTLLHEIGHYLINSEEVDEEVSEKYSEDISSIEKWCNDFAYYFLIGKNDSIIKEMGECTIENNFNMDLLEQISQKTYLSTFSLLTRAKIYGNISFTNYNNIYTKVQENIRQSILKEKEENRKKAELSKELGEKQKGSQPKPIESKLFKDIIRMNYFEGKLSESNVMKVLNVKNKSFEEVIYS